MTARGSRSIFSSPDAVTDIRDIGDRLETLERIPASVPGSLTDAYAWAFTIPDDDSNVFAGKIRFAAGHTRLDFVGYFRAENEDLLSAGIVFPSEFESRNVVAGGIVNATDFGDPGSGAQADWMASGFALIRCSGPKTVPFYARGASDSPIFTRGCLFTTPVRSVAFEA